MKTKIVLIISNIILLTIIIVMALSGTFARYTSQNSASNNSIAVAEWSFTANGFGIARTDTISASQITTGRLAPGTRGTINVNIDVTDCEVGVDYTITLSGFTNKPDNLIIKDEIGNDLVASNGAYSFTGTITLDEHDLYTTNNSVIKTVKIPFEWPYETLPTAGQTQDQVDTIDSEDCETAGNMTFTITVVGTQSTQENLKPTLAQYVAQTDNSKKIKEGDRVLYSAVNANIPTYSPAESVTGSSTASTFSTNASIEWYVFNVDETNGTVDIVGYGPTLTLSETTGFINSMQIMENAAKVYGHGRGAIYARHLTREDLELKTDQSVASKKDFGKASYENNFANLGDHAGYYLGQRQYTSGYFFLETGTYTSGDKKYANYLTGATGGSPIKMTQTYYYKANAGDDFATEHEALKNIIFGTEGSYKRRWLASRCVGLNSGYCNFAVASVSSGLVAAGGLYDSTGGVSTVSLAVSPVITLSSSVRMEKNASGQWVIY